MVERQAILETFFVYFFAAFATLSRMDNTLYIRNDAHLADYLRSIRGTNERRRLFRPGKHTHASKVDQAKLPRLPLREREKREGVSD